MCKCSLGKVRGVLRSCNGEFGVGSTSLQRLEFGSVELFAAIALGILDA